MGFSPEQDVQQSYQLQAQNLAHQTQPTHHEADPAHSLLHQVGGVFGYGTVLITVLLGGTVMYRRFIKKWIGK